MPSMQPKKYAQFTVMNELCGNNQTNIQFGESIPLIAIIQQERCFFWPPGLPSILTSVEMEFS